MSAPKNSKKDPIEQNTQTLHKHLQTQFYGVITKLTQEIDEMTYLKQEIRKPLERLQLQLNLACSIYCNSKTIDLKKSIEEFHQTCQCALKEYKKCPNIQKALQSDDISQESIDNMFSRFNTGIRSAIYYTMNHTCLPNAEQQKLSTAYQLFSALSTRFKQLSGPKKSQLSKTEENSKIIPP